MTYRVSVDIEMPDSDEPLTHEGELDIIEEAVRILTTDPNQAEVLAIVDSDLQVAYYIDAIGPDGEERYPPDDFLRDTSKWPQPLEDIHGARQSMHAVMDDQAWYRATLYRRSPDGATVAVETITIGS
jgi:hypothetical protein